MDFVFRYLTPDGFDNLILRSDGKVLTGLRFEGTHDESKQYPITSYHDLSLLPVIQDTCRWLDLYFSGHQPDFTPKYRIDNLTPFRIEVFEMMCQIPFGRTVTYGEIASTLAKKHGIEKMSAQAVGSAVGWNAIGIIVPCHRVIGANGNLTGYGGGLNNKIALLRLEGYRLDKTKLHKTTTADKLTQHGGGRNLFV